MVDTKLIKKLIAAFAIPNSQTKFKCTFAAYVLGDEGQQ